MKTQSLLLRVQKTINKWFEFGSEFENNFVRDNLVSYTRAEDKVEKAMHWS